MKPDLDTWLDRALVRVSHRREAPVEPSALWAAAQSIRLADTRTLGRLIRLRIPGVSAVTAFDDLFRSPPFTVLYGDDGALVSGLVGRIWTLKRDYPVLENPADFRHWSARGTVRVLFATWVEVTDDGTAALVNETRVDAVDRPARIGLAALAPLIAGSHNLVGSDGLEIAVQRARARSARTASEAEPGQPVA